MRAADDTITDEAFAPALKEVKGLDFIQIDYALEDVRYLLPLHEALERILAGKS